jgi:deoxyribonuclease V
MSELNHRWDLDRREAIAVQERLATRVVRRDQFGPVRTVAGVDVGFVAGDSVVKAAVAVLSFPGLDLIVEATAQLPTPFPYVPGLLSFREGPAILAAIARLGMQPDLYLFDGQGIAHPRRLGIASHIGVRLDVPTIGVAKSRLIGDASERLPVEKGAWVSLWDDGEVVGGLVRTRTAVNPVYVSIGHRVSLQSAVRYVLACTTRYKLPETTRHAHRIASGQEEVDG